MRSLRTLHYLSAAVLILFLTLLGCSTVTLPKPGGDVPPCQRDGRSADSYRRLAQQYEANQRPSKALLLWHAVEDLCPGDATALERISHLSRAIENKGEAHFAKGVEYLEQKSFQAARKEFILALAYNPKKGAAADHLRKLSWRDEFVDYEVQAGDSLENISRTVYGTGDRQSAIAYFGGITDNDDLRPGRILRLPAPDQGLKTKAVHRVRRYSRHREKPKTYDKAGAELHYNKGVAHYLTEKFQQAIKEWEEALRLNPEHAYARRDIRKARLMLRRTGLK